MSFYVGSRYFPAAISKDRINRIARTDIPPEMSLWEKIKEFFFTTHQSEALECIRKICHPPAGTMWQDVADRFERLRTLAYSGYKDNIQSGRKGLNHFCILGDNNEIILSVTLDDTGRYSIEYEELLISHTIATMDPQTTEGNKALLTAWEMAAQPAEASSRIKVAQNIRDCLENNPACLFIKDKNITSLPDHLPPGIESMTIECPALTSLPGLPYRQEHLHIHETPLISLPKLPNKLKSLTVWNTPLTNLPELPHTLKSLIVWNTPLTNLPRLPPELEYLHISGTQLTNLPTLPRKLKRLTVWNTPLTNLPELPHRLRNLEICKTLLTSLPASIADLSSTTQADLRGNPLSGQTIRTLQAIIRERGLSSPRIHFDMARGSPPQGNQSAALAESSG